MNKLMEDLAARFAPSPAQLGRAAEKLAQLEDERWIAVVALVLPGKARGVWELGQEVEHLTGVWVGMDQGNAVMTYERARSAAILAGAQVLAGRPGTVAYVAVHPDGTWAVFEA